MKKNVEGFTLVEVLVVCILMMVLAMGAYSLFNMYLMTSRETAANMRMQRQIEALMDDIGRLVRGANFILPPGGVPVGFNPAVPNPAGAIRPQQIEFFIHGNPNPIGGFQFNANGDGIVRHLVDGQYVPYRIDGGDLTLSTTVNNFFEIEDNWAQLSVDITLETTAPRGQPAFNLTVERGVFQCKL